MRELRCIRFEKSTEGAIGLLIVKGDPFCYTLQPDGSDRRRFYTTDGEYPIRRYSSTKYPDTFEFLVAGHTALLFHSGNIAEDSLGCVLLGSSVGKLRDDRAVLNSGNTFRRFIEVMRSVKEGSIIFQSIYLT